MRNLDSTPIEKAGLSARSLNALKEYGYDTVGAVLKESDDKLMRLPGFGRKSLDEVRSILRGDFGAGMPPAIQRIHDLSSALQLAYGFLFAQPDPSAQAIAERLATVLWSNNKDDAKTTTDCGQ